MGITHGEGKQFPRAPKAQLGCTRDQQQITQGQRTKSHLYILLHRVSLHYLEKTSSLLVFILSLLLSTPAAGE